MPNTAAAPSAPEQPVARPAPRTAEAAAGSLGEAVGRPGALGSPAGRLQAALDAEYAGAVQDAEARWPLRWTVAMVFTTCGAFWLSVYFVVAALIG